MEKVFAKWNNNEDMTYTHTIYMVEDYLEVVGRSPE